MLHYWAASIFIQRFQITKLLANRSCLGTTFPLLSMLALLGKHRSWLEVWEVRYLPQIWHLQMKNIKLFLRLTYFCTIPVKCGSSWPDFLLWIWFLLSENIEHLSVQSWLDPVSSVRQILYLWWLIEGRYSGQEAITNTTTKHFHVWTFNAAWEGDVET